MISVAGIGCYCGLKGPHNHYLGVFMSDQPANTFNATDPNHWVIVGTAFAQLFIAIAPLIAQIISAASVPQQKQN